MTVFDGVGRLPLQQVWDGVSARVVHGERITMGVVELDAGSVVPEHHHDNEQLGICLSGWLVFRIGDETREVRPGDTYTIPANLPHEVLEVGPEGAVVIDVFAPTRDDWKAIAPGEPREPRWP